MTWPYSALFNSFCKMGMMPEMIMMIVKWGMITETSASRCSLQFSSVTQSCLTLCDPMVCSMPGFPVHHQLQELTQTQVHWVGDAIQPSHSLSSPSPPAFDLSQHQGLFQWVSSSHQVAKILISFRIDWFDLLAVQESSPTPQFISINSLALVLLYGPTLRSIHD